MDKYACLERDRNVKPAMPLLSILTERTER